ncbi:MAG TPA: PEGA domain-containing protein [Thermodesulfobacteriota bacterium]|nr:PEGA domain-containing protein [Thermodesulfobacteriota bacterium]
MLLFFMVLFGLEGFLNLGVSAEAKELKSSGSFLLAQWIPNPQPYPPPSYSPRSGNYGRNAQGSGWIHVDVNPPDAEVFLNGLPMGREGNAYEEGVLVGRYKVEVKKEGYLDHTQFVDVYPAAMERIKINLRKVTAKKVPPPSEPYEGGLLPKKVPPSADAKAGPGQSQNWGWVHVETTPGGARVFLDGNLMGPGENSGFEERVLPGRHKVEVKKEGYLDHAEFVDVQASVKERLRVSLKKAGAKSEPKGPPQSKGGEAKPPTPSGPGSVEPFPFK